MTNKQSVPEIKLYTKSIESSNLFCQLHKKLREDNSVTTSQQSSAVIVKTKPPRERTAENSRTCLIQKTALAAPVSRRFQPRKSIDSQDRGPSHNGSMNNIQKHVGVEFYTKMGKEEKTQMVRPLSSMVTASKTRLGNGINCKQNISQIIDNIQASLKTSNRAISKADTQPSSLKIVREMTAQSKYPRGVITKNLIEDRVNVMSLDHL